MEPLLLYSLLAVAVLVCAADFVRVLSFRRSITLKVELLAALSVAAMLAAGCVAPGRFSVVGGVLALTSGSFILLSVPYTYIEDRLLMLCPLVFAIAAVSLQWIGAAVGLRAPMMALYILFILLYLGTYVVSRLRRALGRPGRFVRRFSVLNHLEDMYRMLLATGASLLVLLSLSVRGAVPVYAALGAYLLLCCRGWTRNGLFPMMRIEDSLRGVIAARSRRYVSVKAEIVDQALYERCCRYMAEKRPFLVDSFSLTDLSAALYTNKVYLSKTINYFADKNFRQYVNYYRILYAIELFNGNMHIKVQDMAELSGFHSTVSFNMAFKAVTGETPSEWRQKQRNRRSAVLPSD